MDQTNDPTCSHNCRGRNHQEKSQDDDKIVPSFIVVSDKQIMKLQTDEKISHQTLMQKCVDSDLLSIIDAPDQINNPHADKATKDLPIQLYDYDKDMLSFINDQKLVVPANDDLQIISLDDNKIMSSFIDIPDQKADLSICDTKNNNQESKSQEHDTRTNVPFMARGSDKTIVEPKAYNAQRGRELLLKQYERDLSLVANISNKQIVESQADVMKNCYQSSSQEYDKDGSSIFIISGNQADLIPNAYRLASTLSNIKIENALQPPTIQQLKDTPSMFVHSTATQLQISSNLPSPMSINILPNQPQSLFLQALSKLNESAISFAVNRLSKPPDSSLSRAVMVSNRSVSPELTTPSSLGSAPPSYSFVLRQMAVRRRPRMFGTFIPSPSFVQHTPPPTYTASFDIYLDNVPPPPTRVYNFGFAPMLVVCPDCGFTGMTQVTSKITLCTHLCAIVLCIMCCWICVPLPYIMRSCKDVSHYCRNCRSFLGSYCPTNPENVTIR